MGYVTLEDIEEARKIDVLTYLKNYEPHELVKFSRDTYCTKEHDSLKISKCPYFCSKLGEPWGQNGQFLSP